MKLSQEDQELLKSLLNREEKALHKLYNLYQKQLYKFAYRQLGDPNKAQEITQDIFFDFIEKLRDFRGESSIKTFLFSIARYKVIDVIRRKKIKHILFSAIPVPIVEGLTAVFFDDELEKKELTQKIEKVFSKLPNDYALILRLKYLDGAKLKAIAEKFSLSFKATESLLFRARHAFIQKFHENP